jgi:uncharacterized SAM-binding protein YcdF (DUF218 family)
MKRFLRRALRWTFYALAAYVVWFILTAISIQRVALLPVADQAADVAVVLGAAVWRDKPSPVFEARVRHGVELYRQGLVKKLLFTGGLAEGDRLAESEAARAFAIAAGVPAGDTLVETVSRTTQQNAREAAEVMENENLHTAIVVSDPLHLKRALSMFQSLGIDATPSPTPHTRYTAFGEKLRFLLRETLYLQGFQVLGK